VIPDEDTDFEERGADFCVNCATPGPWVSREGRIEWLRDRVSEFHQDPAEIVKLQQILNKLVQMNPDDAKTLVGWNSLKESVPELWAVAKPILVTVIGPSVRAKLGLP